MSVMCQMLRGEFHLKKFLFAGVHAGRFYNFQWRLPPIVFLVYRLTVAVYVDFWLIYFSSLHVTLTTRPNHRPQPWPCYLTVWTYTVLALYVTLHAALTLCHHTLNPANLLRAPSPAYHSSLFDELSDLSEYEGQGYEQIGDGDTQHEGVSGGRWLPWYLKLVWMLHSVVSVAAVIVTTVFYIFLLPQSPGESAVSLENLQLHTLNTVIIVADSLVSAIPHRLLHFVYTALYGLAYIIFSAVYWLPDHTRVMYPHMLDWNHPAHTIKMICLIVLVLLPLLQLMYHIIYRVKICVLQRILINS